MERLFLQRLLVYRMARLDEEMAECRKNLENSLGKYLRLKHGDNVYELEIFRSERPEELVSASGDIPKSFAADILKTKELHGSRYHIVVDFFMCRAFIKEFFEGESYQRRVYTVKMFDLTDFQTL